MQFHHASVHLADPARYKCVPSKNQILNSTCRMCLVDNQQMWLRNIELHMFLWFGTLTCKATEINIVQYDIVERRKITRCSSATASFHTPCATMSAANLIEQMFSWGPHSTTMTVSGGLRTPAHGSTRRAPQSNGRRDAQHRRCHGCATPRALHLEINEKTYKSTSISTLPGTLLEGNDPVHLHAPLLAHHLFQGFPQSCAVLLDCGLCRLQGLVAQTIRLGFAVPNFDTVSTDW